jgi:Ca-activated chloride channel family protein
MMRHLLTAAGSLILVVSLQAQQAPAPTPPPAKPIPESSFKFKSGVELINVTATVVDANGRFVPGLKQDDFIVYEDDQPQTVTHFSADRVPVSLGIALDTSQSMFGEKIQAARAALERFLFDLLGPDDEFFLYRFSDEPVLMQEWTTDRNAISRALSRAVPSGRTAMFDAVADAVPLAQKGRNRKKALVVISDGNDTSSRTSIHEVKQLIRESEALVYAVGIDCGVETRRSLGRFDERPFGVNAQRRGPIPIPFPLPPGRRPLPPPPNYPPPNGRNPRWGGCTDPVDVAALRDMTDDSGGRTEIIRDSRDLEPATSGIADELSKQYYLGYPASGKKDGRWHSIRVELRNGRYRVRARRGYIAS